MHFTSYPESLVNDRSQADATLDIHQNGFEKKKRKEPSVGEGGTGTHLLLVRV